MKTIERLRELLAKATGPYDSKVDPWMDQRFKARDECLDALPALLAVVEAADAMHEAGVDPRNAAAGKALGELALALRALEGGAGVNHDRCTNCDGYIDELDALRANHAAELAKLEDDYLKLNNIACELRTRAERAEKYVAGQDVRSDFRTAAEMRAALELVEGERDANAATVNVLAAEVKASRVLIERLESANAALRAWKGVRDEPI